MKTHRRFGNAARAGLCAAALGLLSCAQPPAGSQPQGAAPAQAPSPGQVQVQEQVQAQRQYLGWRVFEVRCAQCHGPDATGTDRAPDLLPRVASMSEGRFVAVVLQRYSWAVPADEASREGAGREALIEDILRRRKGEVQMPAWADEPMVQAHVADLYAYLAARADGTLGPAKPRR